MKLLPGKIRLFKTDTFELRLDTKTGEVSSTETNPDKLAKDFFLHFQAISKSGGSTFEIEGVLKCTNIDGLWPEPQHLTEYSFEFWRRFGHYLYAPPPELWDLT